MKRQPPLGMEPSQSELGSFWSAFSAVGLSAGTLFHGDTQPFLEHLLAADDDLSSTSEELSILRSRMTVLKKRMSVDEIVYPHERRYNKLAE